MNLIEKQRAFEYSMFVMLSSYFDKAVCTTNLQQKKLCLAYQELKDEDKQQYDEKSIKVIEEELLPNIPEHFLHDKLGMVLVGKEEKPYTEVRLYNGEYLLRVKSRYDKKKPKLVYEVWRKSAA